MTLDSQFVEKRFHFLADFQHQFEIREKNKCLSASHANEMFDPMH